MDLEEVMELSPESIAEAQFNALKKHTQGILTEMKRHIQHGGFDEALEMLGHSGSGDACGQENRFIDFSYATQNDYTNPLDIGDMLTKLKHLKELK